MRYYEGHESAYQKLQKEGSHSWDEYRKQSEGFDSFCLRGFLEKALARCEFSRREPSALEIGCGTGPASCFLARKGFRVDGIDISETAVAIARKKAEDRALKIAYRAGDVCRDALGEGVYNLIVDGHCLHCIVFEDDRLKALANIRRALRPGGYFWVDTMLATGPVDFGEKTIFDQDGILWSEISGRKGFDAARQVGDKWYVANRRIYSDPDRLKAELEGAGLRIEWQEAEPPQEENTPGTFRAICRPGRDG